jgi:hypothetical protein
MNIVYQDISLARRLRRVDLTRRKRRANVNSIAIALSCAAMLAVAPLTRALQASQPTTRPSVPTTGLIVQHLQAKVTGVEGLVQVRESEDKPWQPCKVGMEVGEGAEFRTGLRSAVRFVIPPDQTITVDRLTTVKVLQAVRDSKGVTTDIGMPGGRMRYDIEKGDVEHRSTVHAPDSTLAIRGTQVSLYDQPPFAPEAVSLTGRAQFSTPKSTTAFGGKNAGKTRVAGDKTATELSLSQSFVDPSNPQARTAAEAPLVANLISRGATLTIDDNKTIPIVTGGFPPSAQQVINLLPGRLNFVVTWSGNTNIDLIVGSQEGNNGKGEILYPATGLNATPDGGRIPFDHRGGPHGGIEIAFWPGVFPVGIFPVIINNNGNTATDVTLQSFVDRRPQLITNGLNGPQGTTILTTKVDPGQSVGGTVHVQAGGGGKGAPANRQKTERKR